MNQEKSVVLIPSFGMGHLIPMVELAKLFSNQGFTVTVAVLSLATDTSTAIDPFVARVSADYPSISFHHLPKVPTSPNSILNHLQPLRYSMTHIRDLVKEIKTSSNLRSLVLDMFCTDAVDIGEELNVPSHIFYPSAASTLAVMWYFPTIQSKLTVSFRDLGDTPLHFPGLFRIPASDLPDPILDRGEANDAIVSVYRNIARAKGVMINTFEWLEKRAVEAIVSGNILPNHVTPRIYCIGPLVISKEEETHECLTWLDVQPEKSVVFLCFGSMGAFTAEQLKETATGLERSGQRFLWVVRSPPKDNNSSMVIGPVPEPDLEALLPKGFMERTKDRGMVVKSWAPQSAVLRHSAVGAFVSHSGWNSTLEAITAGVPIISWPLYAEQRMNKVFLVEEAKLAVEMEGHDKGLVTAEEVEKKIRWLMESDGGKVMRERAVKAKEEAAAAIQEGGSSSRAMLELMGEL